MTATDTPREAVWGSEAWAFDAFVYFVPYRQMLGEVLRSVRPRPGDVVLDAGCGTGNVSRLLLRAGADVVGIDASPAMLARAEQKCADGVFAQHDLNEPLPFRDASFDAVVSVHTLYVLDDPERTLRELARVTAPGGRLVIVHPRPTRPTRALRSHLTSGHVLTVAASAVQLPRFSRLLRDAVPAFNCWRRTACTSEQLADVVNRAGFRTLRTAATYGGISTLLTAKRRQA